MSEPASGHHRDAGPQAQAAADRRRAGRALAELAERHAGEFSELMQRHSRECQEMQDRHWHETNAIETGVPSPPRPLT